MLLVHPLITGYILLSISSAVYAARLARMTEYVEDVTDWTYCNQTDSYYKKFTGKQSFDDAEKKCREYSHSHLTSFHTKQEFDFLLSLKPETGRSFWIGMRHSASPRPDVPPKAKNRFALRFLDGSPMVEFNDTVYADYWAFGEENGWEPNGINGEEEQCIMLNADTIPISHSRKLNDIFCNNQLEFVCKKTVIVPTLQPTIQPLPSSTIGPNPLPSSSAVIVQSLGVMFALAIMVGSAILTQ